MLIRLAFNKWLVSTPAATGVLMLKDTRTAVVTDTLLSTPYEVFCAWRDQCLAVSFRSMIGIVLEGEEHRWGL